MNHVFNLLVKRVAFGESASDQALASAEPRTTGVKPKWDMAAMLAKSPKHDLLVPDTEALLAPAVDRVLTARRPDRRIEDWAP
jgi:hypothetical protein